jgi:hypothetical protein
MSEQKMKVRLVLDLEVGLIEGEELHQFFEGAVLDEGDGESRQDAGEITWETAQPGDFFDPIAFGELVATALTAVTTNADIFDGSDSPLKITGASVVECTADTIGAGK